MRSAIHHHFDPSTIPAHHPTTPPPVYTTPLRTLPPSIPTPLYPASLSTHPMPGPYLPSCPSSTLCDSSLSSLACSTAHIHIHLHFKDLGTNKGREGGREAGREGGTGRPFELLYDVHITSRFFPPSLLSHSHSLSLFLHLFSLSLSLFLHDR